MTYEFFLRKGSLPRKDLSQTNAFCIARCVELWTSEKIGLWTALQHSTLWADCVEKVGVLRRSSKSAEHPPAKAPSLKHSLPKGDMLERCSKILRRFSGCRVFQQNKPKMDIGSAPASVEPVRKSGERADPQFETAQLDTATV